MNIIPPLPKGEDMTIEQKALREEVAKIISGAPFPSARSFSKADEVIAAVLGSAAKVANRMYQKGQTGEDIAAAIRAENERLRAALEDCIEILDDLKWNTGAVERARAALGGEHQCPTHERNW